ncbi:hypothetical protein PFISCL1PPCAC_3522, partial [Pristionchus fissidentatus]
QEKERSKRELCSTMARLNAKANEVVDKRTAALRESRRKIMHQLKREIGEEKEKAKENVVSAKLEWNREMEKAAAEFGDAMGRMEKERKEAIDARVRAVEELEKKKAKADRVIGRAIYFKNAANINYRRANEAKSALASLHRKYSMVVAMANSRSSVLEDDLRKCRLTTEKKKKEIKTIKSACKKRAAESADLIKLLLTSWTAQREETRKASLKAENDAQEKIHQQDVKISGLRRRVSVLAQSAHKYGAIKKAIIGLESSSRKRRHAST